MEIFHPFPFVGNNHLLHRFSAISMPTMMQLIAFNYFWTVKFFTLLFKKCPKSNLNTTYQKKNCCYPFLQTKFLFDASYWRNKCFYLITPHCKMGSDKTLHRKCLDMLLPTTATTRCELAASDSLVARMYYFTSIHTWEPIFKMDSSHKLTQLLTWYYVLLLCRSLYPPFQKA